MIEVVEPRYEFRTWAKNPLTERDPGVAEKIGASSIVMGSRGQTGLKYLFLSSKAERVVQLAEIPVTIVKGQKPKR
jgi:nucleotide-binding universal stress UspA family protein